LSPKLASDAGPGIPLPSSVPFPAMVLTVPVSPRAAVTGAVVVEITLVVVVGAALELEDAAGLELPPQPASTATAAEAKTIVRRRRCRASCC
jgi:hypothetical protein